MLLTIIVFVLILSLLIFVHELGHFVTAKKAGIVVEEFGIGYPPRAIKLWQDEGKITLDGHEFIIGRKTNVPRKLQVGSEVYVETIPRPDGQVEVTRIEVIDPDNKKEGDTRPTATVEGLEKPTEYSLNWIPFGGYVKMLGEEDPSAPGSFASKSKRVRFVVLVAGATMNLITAVIIFTIMFMTGQPEPIGPTFITDVIPNSPAEAVGLQPGDQILQVDDVKIETATDLVEYTRARRGQEVTLTILRHGRQGQIRITPRRNPPPGEGAMGVGIYTQYAQLRVNAVSPNSPAEAAGLQPGDIIHEVDGKLVEAPTALVAYMRERRGRSIMLTVRRGDADLTLTLEPDADAPPPADAPLDNALIQSVPAIGAELEADLFGQRIVKQSPPQALLMGVSATAGIVAQTFTVPIAVLRKIIPAEQARPVGPFGIYQITDTAVDVSRETNVIYPILFVAAILSTALAVTNLLPLPALDGGRILFIIVEAIRGKRIAPEKEGAIHFIGLALLLMLMVIISYYDLTNPIDVSGIFR